MHGKSQNTLKKLTLLAVMIIISICSKSDAITLSGTVSDIGSNPLNPVIVKLMYNASELARDTTDFTGFYSIYVAVGAVFDLDIVANPSLNVQNKFIQGVDVTANTLLDITLFPTGHYYIEGVVTNSQGMGLPFIDLNIYDQVTGNLIETTGDDTDSTGYYDVLVPIGLYRIIYRPIAGQLYVPMQLQNVQVVGNTVIDVTLDTGYQVYGHVGGPSGNVVNADLDVDDSLTGERIITLNDNTDGLGNYQIIVPAGIFNINVTPLITDRLVPAIEYGIAVTNANVNLNFNLSSGNMLSGYVYDHHSQPVDMIDIDVFDFGSGLKLFTPNDNTNEFGFFQMILPVGIYDIEFEPFESLNLAAKKLVDFAFNSDSVISVVLDTGMYVSGIVTDSTGGLISNVSFMASVSGSGQPVFTPGAHTDSLGFYDLFIPQGVYDLKFLTDSLAGPADSINLLNVAIAKDTVINIAFLGSVIDSIPPQVTIISPNGGEEWVAGSVHQLNWNATDNIGVNTIDLYYSINGAAGTYILITSGEPNDDIYSWTVPAQYSNNVYIKGVGHDYSTNSGEDVSNSAFTISEPSSNCDYAVGDVNNTGGMNGLDITFSVSYLKGGIPPDYTCECTPGSVWFVSGDVNQSCSFNGLDVTYGVNYLKGGPPLMPCPDCPPAR